MAAGANELASKLRGISSRPVSGAGSQPSTAMSPDESKGPQKLADVNKARDGNSGGARL